MGRVLAPGGRWLLADFIGTGLLRYLRRLPRLTQFPERPGLAATLSAAALTVMAERRVPGLAGQVTVMAIRSQSAAGSRKRNTRSLKWLVSSSISM